MVQMPHLEVLQTQNCLEMETWKSVSGVTPRSITKPEGGHIVWLLCVFVSTTPSPGLAQLPVFCLSVLSAWHSYPPLSRDRTHVTKLLSPCIFGQRASHTFRSIPVTTGFVSSPDQVLLSHHRPPILRPYSTCNKWVTFLLDVLFRPTVQKLGYYLLILS